MSVVIQWREKTLSLDENAMFFVSGLTIKSSVKLKEHMDSGRAYKNSENAEAPTVSFTVSLHQSMGVDVKAEIQSWLTMANDGERGRLYIAGVDFIGEDALLSSCEVSKVGMLPNGTMKSAELKLSFVASKQEPAPPAPASSSKKKKKKTTKSSGLPSTSYSGMYTGTKGTSKTTSGSAFK